MCGPYLARASLVRVPSLSASSKHASATSSVLAALSSLSAAESAVPCPLLPRATRTRAIPRAALPPPLRAQPRHRRRRSPATLAPLSLHTPLGGVAPASVPLGASVCAPARWHYINNHLRGMPLARWRLPKFACAPAGRCPGQQHHPANRREWAGEHLGACTSHRVCVAAWDGGGGGGGGGGEGEGEGEGEGNSPPAPASDDDGCPQCDAPLACLSAACCCACPAQPGGQSPAELAEVAPTAGEACRRRALRMPPPQRPGAVCSALGVVGLLWAAAAAAVLAYRGHQAIGRVGAPAPGLRAIDIDIGVGIGTGIGIEAPPPPPPAASSTAWERATRSAREEEALRERAASSGAARDAGAAGP